jgi:hypothetical protein
MKKFVVERNLPGAENLSPEELQSLAQTFCDAANNLEKVYIWIESFITGDKIYCIVIAENEQVIREHARSGRMPVNIISEVKTTIDPTTSASLNRLKQIA